MKIIKQTDFVQLTLTNPNSLGPALVQISESFILQGTTYFFLMHIKITMNIISMGFGLVRFLIN